MKKSTIFAIGISALTCSALWAQTSTTATGTSRAFNPAISANGLFLGALHSGAPNQERDEGLSAEEFEVQLSSSVDSYLRADLILALPGGEGVEMEEGFVTTLGLPANLALKVGKFYADLGKHNSLHTHRFPFIDPPLVNERLLGDEGLNEVGISLNWLAPTPWYSELSAQVLDGENELFASENGRDLTYLIHAKNFFDLSANTTLELGGSYALGQNTFARLSQLAGVDLTLKWQSPRQATYRSIVLQSEYLYAKQKGNAALGEEGGFYTYAQYQFARRWWLQGRYDLFGTPLGKTRISREQRLSALLSFAPSEFSALRLQYSYRDERGETGNEILLQFNFTIGSHPAHSY